MGIKNLSNKMYEGDNILSLSDVRYLPRWIVMLIDAIILFFSLFFSYFILDKLNVRPPTEWPLGIKFLFVLMVNGLFMYVFRTFSGIIRHSTFVDLFKLFLACLCTLVTLSIFNYLYLYIGGSKLFLTPLFFIYAMVSFTLLFAFRLVVKEFFHVLRQLKARGDSNRILVLGISESSVAIARAILDNPNLPYDLIGFLTDRKDSESARLLGKEIISKDKLRAKSKAELNVDGVLIIKELLTRDELNSWVNILLEKDIKIFKSPTLQKFRPGDLANSIKEMQIEDLLNRKPIKIDNDAISPRHEDKIILVTGGAGSIGAEIVRQVAKFNPKTIVVLDQAETPLYQIELEMKQEFPHIHFEFILADISNERRIEPVFKKFQFSMVYHAAAYKHVPLIEKNPREAILVNVLGTKNLSMFSSKYKVNRFVMISTDKAVNPTNVMGASKRMAELFVQSLQNLEGNQTKFITTRFGNVLGSNGSVIPHFKKQIEAGGPITVTHKDIVRYFMTIPEACELVLQAGTMGKGGEIFVFDMGEPVKIVNLARRMIKLSGFRPDEDIKIIFTGLRPGEKLYEELLSDGAKTLPTPHSSILISKDSTVEFSVIKRYTQQITIAALKCENDDIVKLLKEIVPEFKSENSIYQTLDL